MSKSQRLLNVEQIRRLPSIVAKQNAATEPLTDEELQILLMAREEREGMSDIDGIWIGNERGSVVAARLRAERESKNE